MKHAIMIIAHNNIEIMKMFLKLYDDVDIDFYIHIDKKSKKFRCEELNDICIHSNIVFLKRHSVYWTGYTQIATELDLLEKASSVGYDYYHLISGVDIPLKTKDEFKKFFQKNEGYEFVEMVSQEILENNHVVDRIKYYYIFSRSLRMKNAFIRKLMTFCRRSFLKIQNFLHIDRLKNADFELKYGSNWFSISNAFANYVCEHKDWIYTHFRLSYCADELFLQSLLFKSPYKDKNYYSIDKDNEIIAGRYVDWVRGGPYVFQSSDFNELTHADQYLFARKFDWNTDSEIIIKLFEFLAEKESMVNEN